MTKRRDGSRPCTDPDCRVDHSAHDRIALAVSICEARGVQMTELRRRTLEFLWAHRRPMGAYELIDAFKHRDSRRVLSPRTVYDVLRFLIEQGFVSRIESLNAYVPCMHPERDRDRVCLFFICTGCGATVEFEDSRVARLFAEDAADLGFVATHRMVEIQGNCAKCAGAAAPGSLSASGAEEIVSDTPTESGTEIPPARPPHRESF